MWVIITAPERGEVERALKSSASRSRGCLREGNLMLETMQRASR